MQSFDSFLDSLSADDLDWANCVTDADVETLKSNIRECSDNSEIQGVIIAHCSGFAVRWLELYHRWLSTQL